jgi:hypothetical protein
MANKEIIAYGVRMEWNNAEVLYLTSWDRNYFAGRTAGGSRTNGNAKNLKGIFATEEAAKAVVKELHRIKGEMVPIYKTLDDGRRAADVHREELMKQMYAAIEAEHGTRLL